MTWIGAADALATWRPESDHRPVPGRGGLCPKGSIILDFALVDRTRSQTILDVACDVPWPTHLRIAWHPATAEAGAKPAGGMIAVTLVQDGSTRTWQSDPLHRGLRGALRLTFAWNGPARFGRISVESLSRGGAALTVFKRSQPLPRAVMEAILDNAARSIARRDFSAVALSSRIEPIGPMPGLVGTVPIDTPAGRRPVSDLRPGDLVSLSSGQTARVQAHLVRKMPSVGPFRLVRLRMPYFGLSRDIHVAAHAQVLLRGADLEYTLGEEAALVSAGLLRQGNALRLERRTGLVTLYQVALDRHDVLSAAGAPVAPVSLGGLAGDPRVLAASLLPGCPPGMLAHHRAMQLPVLDLHEARMLRDGIAAA